MPSLFEIPTDVIKEVAVELKLDLTDPEHLAVLQEAETCDVQAGPGSGKTTLLTAKLAVLAKNWPFKDRGICVLSHTNVARTEIEKRLSQSCDLRKLLTYPHYIGTIQTFANQFLAIPYLNKKETQHVSIDDDRFAVRAWSEFCKRYPKPRSALQRYFQNDQAKVASVVCNLRLNGATMQVTHPAIKYNRFPGPNSATGRALVELKQSLSKEGYFRFQDMFAFAEACIFEFPYIPKALRRRFPWVFIDEFQDTSLTQESLIENVFSHDDCAIQRFGDKNQAIFDFDGDSDDGLSLFGRRKTLFLNSTHRFGSGIADFVSHLTAVNSQELIGNPKSPNGPHTIFVYDRAAIEKVIPLFADLTLKNVPADVLRIHDVCVVGSRINSANHTTDNFPSFLGDYCSSYVSPKAERPKYPDTLIGYLYDARKNNCRFSDRVNLANQGILALIRKADPLTKLLTKSALHRDLTTRGKRDDFNRLLWCLLNPAVALNESLWKKSIAELTTILQLTPSNELKPFFIWQSQHPGRTLSPATQSSSPGIYTYRTGNSELSIRLASIHSVKGETHAATLLVETFSNRQHDLKSLLPVLTKQVHGSELATSVRSLCKQVFVAMSRPSHLLCLAISAEHVSPSEINALEKNGWKIQRVI